MNRRAFLASLIAVPAGVALAVKARVNAPQDNPYKCIITPNFRGSITSRQWYDYDFVCDAKTKEHIDITFAKYYREKYGVIIK